MPIDVTCSSCGTPYALKDEFAGKKVRCRECQNVILIPAAADSFQELEEVGPGARSLPAEFRRDKFLLKQKKISISEKYYVFDDQKNPILFVERPAHVLKGCLAILGAIGAFLVLFAIAMVGFSVLDSAGNKLAAGIVMVVGLILATILTIVVAIALSPKRHIRFYNDDTKSRLVLEVLQDTKFNPIRATYTVIDPADGVLGRFQKNYLYNFFRKRWYGLRPDDSVFMLAQEDSLILALLRRVLGSIELLGMLLVTNFVFHLPGSSEVIGEFNRKFTLFDQYVLDLTADRQRILDRRMALALGVLLDTGERR